MMFLAPIAAFCITGIALLILLRSPLKHIAMDQPNPRSLHTVPIPRTGGLAITLGILLVWYVCLDTWLWASLALGLLILSTIDDMRGLSVKWRFIIQITICIVFVAYYFSTLPWWLNVAIVIALAWMINLYNFMDGSDGLAGGMALIGFSTYACAAVSAGHTAIALIGFTAASASLAFLFFNFHPAKIFMGDGGSIPLGFLAASLGLYGWQANLWPLWFPILVFSPFIIDATVTLIKRFFRGEKVWQAHRSHYYQRLVQMGLGHKKLAICEYILMTTVCASALVLRKLDDYSLIAGMVAWSLIYLVILLAIDHYWKRFTHLNALTL